MSASMKYLEALVLQDDMQDYKTRHTMEFPKPPLPLTFDYVMEGYPPAAPSNPFIRIPTELKDAILQYLSLDKEALAALALLSSDFRQLARSCQFYCLTLKYGSRAYKIVDVIRREAIERMTSCDGRPHCPSLGFCVRHLRVDCRIYDPDHKKTQNLHFLLRGMREDLYKLRLDGGKGAERKYTGIHAMKYFTPDIFGAISSLPNLKSLSLLNCPLCDELVDALMRSPAIHLRLDGYFRPNLKLRPNRDDWALESLGINFRVMNHGVQRLDVSPFWAELLWLCCSTLRYLKLEQQVSSRPPEQKFLPLCFNLKFPNLRTVLLYGGIPFSAHALSSLLQSEDLSTLRLQFDAEDLSIRKCLDRPIKRPKLETLVVDWFRQPQSKDFNFIKVNTGIKSLVLTAPGNWGLGMFNLSAVRSLTEHTNLKLLSLKWGNESTIPDVNQVISALAKLPFLEVLHLHVAEWDLWYIDHQLMIDGLAPLVNLKRLIFEGDKYDRLLPKFDYRRNDDSPRHVGRMLQAAQLYIAPFPKLEFLHVGQVLIRFERDADGHRHPTMAGTTLNQIDGYDVEKRELGIEGPASSLDYATALASTRFYPP